MRKNGCEENDPWTLKEDNNLGGEAPNGEQRYQGGWGDRQKENTLFENVIMVSNTLYAGLQNIIFKKDGEMTQEIKTLISRSDDLCIQEYIQLLEPTWLKEKTNFCKFSSDLNTHKIK